MNQEIHIVAVGARTPLGLDAESSFAAFQAGISQIGETPFFYDKHDEPVRIALDHTIRPELWGPERKLLLTRYAVEDVCSQIDFEQLGIRELPVYVGLPEERPGWGRGNIESLHRMLDEVELPIKFESIKVFPHGHAAGLMAMAAASSELSSQRDSLSLVLGVDSYMGFDTLKWLDENRQLANSYNRGAFYPGEGAGAVLVASRDALSRHRLNSVARIQKFGYSIESKKIKTDDLCLGEGLTQCVQMLIQDLQQPEEKIDGVICDINGERYRAEEWGFALLRMGQYFVDPTEYELPASCWGDVGAASGPLFIGIAATAGQKGWAKGQRYMIWNSSESGHRAGILMDLNFN